MAIFSYYAIPGLLFMAGILYDHRLIDASGISFVLIGVLCVFDLLPFMGIWGILGGFLIIGINWFRPKLFFPEDRPEVHFHINIKEKFVSFFGRQ